jgi:hypothetical protein
MNPRTGLFWAAGLLVGSALFGCGDVSTIPDSGDADAGLQTPSGSPVDDLAASDPSPAPAEDVNQETPPEQPQAQSVGDVTVEIAGRAFEPGEFESADASISARVLNESEYTIDVTLRFISQETTVHLAYLRVMPETVTTVTSPKPASEVLLSGVDERGQAVPAARFVSGKDFDETTPAVYRFSVVDDDDEATSEQPEPEEPPVSDRVAVEVKPEPYFPPLLSMLEPASDVTLALGSALFVQWEDYAVRPGTTVIINLHPVGAREHDQHIQLTPAMGAALDGINDELVMVLESIEEGVYEVVGRIDDGVNQMTAVAPGRVTVRLDEGNEAPVLAITAPLEVVELQAGSALFLSWEDEDADDNATVTFGLVASAQDGTVLAGYAMDSMFSEDPDGSADVAYWPLDHVIPGTYDLVGTIDDGKLMGTDRVDGVVVVLPAPDNDAPQIELTAPGAELAIEAGGSITIQWIDSDDNDNALIAFMLDPTLSAPELSGDEIVLTSSVAEDGDGVGDVITLGIPEDVAVGPYRVAALISDGMAQSVAFAPGLVHVEAPSLRIDLLPSIEFIAPADDITIHLGEPIFARAVGEHIPQGSAIRFILSNELDGGEVRINLPQPIVELDKAGLPFEAGLPFDMEVFLDTEDLPLPADALPRTFSLEVEADLGSILVRATAPGKICIWKELEIVGADVLGDLCQMMEYPPLPYPSHESIDDAIIIDWVAPDGCPETESVPLPEVEFWLSKDGAIPTDGDEDLEHQLILKADFEPGEAAEELVPFSEFSEIRPGFYELIAVLRSLDGEVEGLVYLEDSVIDVCTARRD